MRLILIPDTLQYCNYVLDCSATRRERLFLDQNRKTTPLFDFQNGYSNPSSSCDSRTGYDSLADVCNKDRTKHVWCRRFSRSVDHDPRRHVIRLRSDRSDDGIESAQAEEDSIVSRCSSDTTTRASQTERRLRRLEAGGGSNSRRHRRYREFSVSRSVVPDY